MCIRDSFTHSAVSDNSSYIVDNTPPTISSVEIDNATNKQNNFLNAGDNVTLKVTFSEAPISAVINDNASAATLTLVVGSDNRTAAYDSGDSTIVSSGSDNATLVFSYIIQATGTPGENDDDGISIPANALNSDSITISDVAGNIATDLTHDAVDNNSSYKVDTIRPSVDNFTMSDTELKIGDNATVTLKFSEPVCGSTSECTRSETNLVNPYFSNADITFPNLANGNPPGTLSTMTSISDIVKLSTEGRMVSTLTLELSGTALCERLSEMLPAASLIVILLELMALAGMPVSYTHLTLPTKA